MIYEYRMIVEKYPWLISKLTYSEIYAIFNSKFGKIREFNGEIKSKLGNDFLDVISALSRITSTLEKRRRVAALLHNTYVDLSKTDFDLEFKALVIYEWALHRKEWITFREKEILKKYVTSSFGEPGRYPLRKKVIRVLRDVIKEEVKNGEMTPGDAKRYFHELSLLLPSHDELKGYINNIIGFFNKMERKRNGFKKIEYKGIPIHKSLPRKSFKPIQM